MILIIGGVGQGKRQVALELLDVTKEMFDRQCADGWLNDNEKAKGSPYVINFHQFLRKQLLVGGDAHLFTKQIIEATPEIIIMDEVGCGVVPLDAFERRYREAVGEAGQMLAKAASHVYRVTCGIAVLIR